VAPLRARGGFLVDIEPLPHQIRGLGNAVSSPSGVWGGAAACLGGFSRILVTPERLSCLTQTVMSQH